MRYLLLFFLLLPASVQAQTPSDIQASLDSLTSVVVHGPDSLGTLWIEQRYQSGVVVEIFTLENGEVYTWKIAGPGEARILTDTRGVVYLALPDYLASEQLVRSDAEPADLVAAMQAIQAQGAAKYRTQPVIE